MKNIKDLYLFANDLMGSEQDCTLDTVIDAILNVLEEVILVDDVEDEKLDNFLDKFRELKCEIAGHTWEHDHCGYWGHKLCYGCGKKKYPELAGMRCGEAIKKFGDEEEYENREM